MGKYVQEISSAEFETLVQASAEKVLLDFYSTECSPCEALAPKFDEFAELFGSEIKFYKMFRQQNRELASSLGVKGSPTLLFFDAGKEVADRLSGEIRKEAIGERIRAMIGDEKFRQGMAKKKKQFREADVVVLGAGPAGLTAGIYAGQAKLKTIIVDQALPGGQVKVTHMMSNYPGTGKPLSGMELMDRMETQAKESGAEVIAAVDVTALDLSESGGKHRVVLDGDIEIEARAVILAMGSEPRPIGVPGEKEYKGRGISYCATCDGKYYDGQEVVVIGGGNSAVEESLFLTRFATKVTVVHQFDHLQANKTAQEHAFANERIHFVWDSEPRKFEQTADGKMKVSIENVKTKESQELVTDGVFVFIGYIPNTSAVKADLHRDKWGYLQVNEDMETNLPGVYAVGDIRSKKYRQAATAVSDGCIAAIVAEKYVEAMKAKEKEALKKAS